jgi:hypothetical protein
MEGPQIPKTSCSSSVATLTLGLRPNQGFTRVWAKREARESHLMLSRVQKSVRKCTLTLPSELPFWQFDSQPPKVKNCPNFLAFKWRATYCWKALNKVYNFALDLILIEGLHVKLWTHKIMEVLVEGILGLPSGSPETKCHLNVGPMFSHKVYYKGEGSDSPQVQAMVRLVSFMNLSLPMVHPSTKSAQIKH